MTAYTFREVKLKRTVKVPCINCGKRLTRVVEAFQTFNPYNLNKSGEVKTEREIRSELPSELDKNEKRLRERTVCKGCQPKS